ncbi:HPr family phosphocarrier protein [Mycoplasma sp. P36-A1]|uniref:HPr family phosphocarrier protein n=1 Tax=Mycoplasma sp. P36-A1 TaxID=3252900 RepID=UPI003C2EC3E0
MQTIKLQIIEPIGIHAKIAANIVNVASHFNSDITIICDNKSANLKSILNILALGIANGQNIEITIDGSDEYEAAHSITEFFIEKQIAKVIYY